MDIRLEIFVKVENLSSCFDLDKNCKYFTLPLFAFRYITRIVGDGWYLHFNGFDSRCNALQYLVCNKDHNAFGYLWFRLSCDNNKNK